MPTIEFLYGGYWMQADPEDYMLRWNDYYWACIQDGGDDDYFILGSAFLRGFYSTHDHTNERFGFAPHSDSLKAGPYAGTVPDTDLPESDEFTGIANGGLTLAKSVMLALVATAVSMF